MHTDARQHFLGFDGFGHVVHAAGLQRSHQVFGLGQPGHKNDGDVSRCGIGLQALGHFKAIYAGHHRIEQHDVRQGLGSARQRGLAVCGHQYRVT